MRIEVVGYDGMSLQARTYAEYRLFAELSRVVDTNRVRHARLVLQRTKDDRMRDSVSCTVTVDIEGNVPRRIRTSGEHPYAAINRAVERMGHLAVQSQVAHHAARPRAPDRDARARGGALEQRRLTTVHDVPARDTMLGVHVADLDTAHLRDEGRIAFTFFWPDAGRWEGTDFLVCVE